MVWFTALSRVFTHRSVQAPGSLSGCRPAVQPRSTTWTCFLLCQPQLPACLSAKPPTLQFLCWHAMHACTLLFVSRLLWICACCCCASLFYMFHKILAHQLSTPSPTASCQEGLPPAALPWWSAWMCIAAPKRGCHCFLEVCLIPVLGMLLHVSSSSRVSWEICMQPICAKIRSGWD